MAIALTAAAVHGKALTFMAKYDQREGNSCHIHLSLRGADGALAFWDDGTGAPLAAVRLLHRRSAGHPGRLHPAVRPEHQLLQAVLRRLVRADYHRLGRGQPDLADPAGRARASARLENRVPGGDVNPYLALAGMLAGGMPGIDHQLALPPQTLGNTYASTLPRVPATLRAARDAFDGSAVARATTS